MIAMIPNLCIEKYLHSMHLRNKEHNKANSIKANGKKEVTNTLKI